MTRLQSTKKHLHTKGEFRQQLSKGSAKHTSVQIRLSLLIIHALMVLTGGRIDESCYHLLMSISTMPSRKYSAAPCDKI
jgi:hypothetical protein